MAATSLISSSSLCFSSSSSSWSSRSNSSGGGENYGVGCFSTPSSYKVKRAVAISCSLNPTPATATTETTRKPPQIELEFIGPKATEDGSYPVERASAISGEKLLRNIMLDNKIELYAAYGKVMNCGGGGSCGTCIVEIIDGQHLLNERTDTEKRYLKKKPDSWRLACQTIVGNKENAGKVAVQRMPQWKK